MQAKERLYLTGDRKALVGEGDKRAASLYAVPGDEIPQSAAERFGLVDGRLKSSAARIRTEEAEKEAREKADKEAKGGDDKGGGNKGLTVEKRRKD